MSNKQPKLKKGRNGLGGVARILKDLHVLPRRVVERGVDVPQALQVQLQRVKLRLVNLHNRLDVVADVAEADHVRDSLSANAIIGSDVVHDYLQLILSVAQRIDAVLLHGDAEVVAVFHARQFEDNPHLHGVENGNGVIHLLLEILDESHEVLGITTQSESHLVDRELVRFGEVEHRNICLF